MSDLPSIDQPENLDHDDVEGHVLRAGKLTTDDRDDVEAHEFRRSLDDQSVPVAEDTPHGDDTEGHALKAHGLLSDEDDTEGHATRVRL